MAYNMYDYHIWEVPKLFKFLQLPDASFVGKNLRTDYGSFVSIEEATEYVANNLPPGWYIIGRAHNFTADARVKKDTQRRTKVHRFK